MKKRRADLLKKHNSKIVLADTLESEAMVDLAMKANDIFLKLKKLQAWVWILKMQMKC